jgi:hypothetical protein
MARRISGELIEKKVFMVRGQRVMFDKDLAKIYGVSTGNLNRAVDRNFDRFPSDFMFQLTTDEFENLIFHFGISSWGGRRSVPRAFTEHGILMLSSALHSKRAVRVNIEIMRVFVRLRRILESQKDFAKKLDDMEKKYDQNFKVVFDAIRKLMEMPPAPAKRPIGFHVKYD